METENQTQNQPEQKKKQLDPAIEAKIIATKRKHICLDLIDQLNKNYSLKKLPKIDDEGKTVEFIPLDIVQNFVKTQQTMLATLIYLGMDLENREYFCMDLRVGERYPEEKKGKNK